MLSCWQGVGDCIPLSQDDGEWIGCLPNKIAICATVASGNNTDYCSALLLNRDSKSGIQQGLTIGIIVGGGAGYLCLVFIPFGKPNNKKIIVEQNLSQ